LDFIKFFLDLRDQKGSCFKIDFVCLSYAIKHKHIYFLKFVDSLENKVELYDSILNDAVLLRNDIFEEVSFYL